MKTNLDPFERLWDAICRGHLFPSVPVLNFSCYWLLLRKRWNAENNNRPDIWFSPIIETLSGKWKCIP